MASTKAQVKICAACGRPFTNRKKWSSRGVWDQVIYCSQRCRGDGAAASPEPPAPTPARRRR